MKIEFEPGDLVRLKSGGPLMTVNKNQCGWVECIWFCAGTKDQKKADFAPEVLEEAGTAVMCLSVAGREPTNKETYTIVGERTAPADRLPAW